MRPALLSLALALGAAGGLRADAPLLPQKPTLSRSHVVFVYAGDLWAVGRDGGEARRLTSGVGLETDPFFSPDGSQIAFTAEYDGNLDVYVVPAAGGEPKRLTYHPGIDTALGWTPDGKSVLFSSGRTSYSRFEKLFTVPTQGGGLPAELPLPMGVQGALSPDGRQIAYVPFWNRRSVPNNYIAWKRYRGGKASPVWLADLSDSRVEKLPRTDSNDFCPFWFEGKVYFLSDRDGPVTLFAYDPASREVKKVYDNDGLDLVSASAGPDAVVFEQFGALGVLDPRTGSAKKLDITITGDFPATRPHVAKAGKKVSNASLSPTGARAAFEARGEIVTVPAEKGDVRNLTQTTGAAERDPAWSPDGKTIAYFSDESGEYELHLRDAKGTSAARRVRLGDAPNFYYNPQWSPDSKKIAYTDNRSTQWLLDVESGKSAVVDKHAFAGGNSFDAAWSPDSKWLAYTKSLPNRLRAAYLYEVAANKSHKLTDGLSDVRMPAFDRSGKYLYFTASTDAGPSTGGIDMSAMERRATRSVYVAVLDKALPSPLAPESDEEKGADAKKDEDKDRDGKPDDPRAALAARLKEAAKPAVTKVDLDGLDQRVLALPVRAGSYLGLAAGKANTLYLIEAPSGGMPVAGPEALGFTVRKFDLTTRKSEAAYEGVSAFEVSANGEKALIARTTDPVRGERKWQIVTLGGAGGAAASRLAALAGGAARPDATLATDDIEVAVDPRVEWKQMYREAWRIERDFLYDPNFHGYDLAAAEKKYARFLAGVRHRADLNYLFNDMLGEISLGHLYVGGGETPEVNRVRGGLLGADLSAENGRYRFARVFSGENWNPQARAPLTQPGVNVKAGEYLLAVNGKALTAADNVYKALEGTAGKQVTLKVGPDPAGKDARDVTVVPTESEAVLRNLGWVEGNRKKVDEMSGGKIAYVYMPDTANGGYAAFNRYFFAQSDKQALVLDERFNGGGKAADYVIDYLRRPLLNYWTTRDGGVYATPGGAIYGPKAMIINEFAGSGGDAMPWYFRRTNLGPLVGKRTWGGLVGIGGYPPLMDGGSVTAPHFAFFSPDGTWDVENRGVAPDVEVEHDPYLVRQGRDPQLETAVELVLKELEKNPPKKPKVPAYPNYHPKGGKPAAAGQ